MLVPQRSRACSFSLRYRIALAAAPEVRASGGGRLREFAFAPVETSDGAFRLGVQYLPSPAAALVEVASAPLPQVSKYPHLRSPTLIVKP